MFALNVHVRYICTHVVPLFVSLGAIVPTLYRPTVLRRNVRGESGELVQSDLNQWIVAGGPRARGRRLQVEATLQSTIPNSSAWESEFWEGERSGEVDSDVMVITERLFFREGRGDDPNSSAWPWLTALPENPTIVLTAGASAPEGLAVVEEIMDVVGGTLTDGDPSNEVDISMAGFVLTRTQFPARSLFPRMHKGSF